MQYLDISIKARGDDLFEYQYIVNKYHVLFKWDWSSTHFLLDDIFHQRSKQYFKEFFLGAF